MTVNYITTFILYKVVVVILPGFLYGVRLNLFFNYKLWFFTKF